VTIAIVATDQYHYNVMKISQILWDVDSILHIAKHHVEPEEVEEAIFEGDAIVLKGRQGSYILLSQSGSGKYLMIVVAFKMKGRIRVITAREMNRKERIYYRSQAK
jgi:uncharacterized protein